MRVSRRTTCAAQRNASSTAAASPLLESTAMFDCASSHTSGAPSAVASTAVVTAGIGSQSTENCSAASRAAAAVSPMTIATKRARSAGRGGCGVRKNREPSRLLSGTSWGFMGIG